jgi:hypothetical protein
MLKLVQYGCGDERGCAQDVPSQLACCVVTQYILFSRCPRFAHTCMHDSVAFFAIPKELHNTNKSSVSRKQNTILLQAIHIF